MIAEEFINQMIPPLRTADTAANALSWMQELHVRQLPVVREGEYLGLVNQDSLMEEPTLLLVDMEMFAPTIHAFRHESYMDVLKTAKQHQLQVVAVLDMDQTYVGSIVVDETMAFFSQSQGSDPGSTLVLSMPERNYSLSEISRLVESNDAKIISSHVSTYPYDRSQVQLTIKINRPDISRIIATFERFEYEVVAKYQQETARDEDKERLDLLLKYLSI
jgi:acetoin utilization protein AcuB